VRKAEEGHVSQGEVDTAFRQFGLSVRIMGREKTLYSVYRKMDSKHLSFSQVTDIYGFRIVVPELSDCYTAMGVLHQLYKPLPGKFRDYVAIPKVNGYQSLHTTLIGPFGTNIEFQLRTHAMDVVAESVKAVYEQRESVKGLKMIYEPKYLRFFQARFEPL